MLLYKTYIYHILGDILKKKVTFINPDSFAKWSFIIFALDAHLRVLSQK